jgi:hypothetical protein
MHVKLDVTTQNPTFYYLDKDNKEVVVDFNAIETKTKIGKGIAGDKTVPANYDLTKDLVAADLKEGQIIYKYDSEDGAFYINMTEDIVQTFNENKEIKETLNTIVTEYLSKGGNVYYGEIKTGEGKVLYELIGDVKTPIDISKDILKVIENETNNLVIEKIKELTTVKIEEGGSATGEVIGGKKVFKAIVTGVVEKVSDTMKYNSNFNGKLAVKKFGRLLSVKILAQVNGQLVSSNVTDVVATEATLDFKFGVGKMYSPLAEGSYDVVIEYVSTEDAK